LFNQPHSAQAAVPWQPNAGIAKKLSSRGYASTSWTSDAPETFADLGYPAQSSGFSAAHYQSMRQPLTQQAQASLALLEGESRNELFGEEKPTPQEGAETNAHLPFVMDAYGASRKSKLRVNVDPQVLKRALAQADLAETLVLSPITSDDQGAEPVVIHPDVVEPSDAMPEVAVSASEPEPELELEPEPVIPELPAVMGGIPPEEVAQREAEQFAKGLAQAQEAAAVQLAEAIEKAMAEGLSKGLEQGKTDGLAEGLAEGLQMGLEQGKAQGLAEGEQTARDAVAEEMAAQRVIFENVSSELGALIADPKKFFEPLKRLALHLAEQVVVGELETSSKAMERLVQRCLDELDHPVHGAVVLELNPDDKARLQAHAGDFLKGMRLEAVHDMKPGSVRVFANDTVVEDLVAHRLEGLARALLVDVEAWREKSPLAQRILEVSEEAEGGDVHS